MTWAFIPLMALLNRFRGGGFGAEILPGHPRFYVAPMVVMLVGLVVEWHQGLLVGAAYLAWSFTPWGHLIGLGRWDPPREWSWLETTTFEISNKNPWLALGMIEMIGMSVAIVIFSPWAALAAIAFVGCYEAGWRLRPKAPIELAELLVGGVWGLLILVALSGCAPSRSYDWGALARGVGQVERGQ